MRIDEEPASRRIWRGLPRSGRAGGRARDSYGCESPMRRRRASSRWVKPRTSSPLMPRSSSAEGLPELLAELPPEMRRQAFTHASWVEHRSHSYERLAFLGDVVLSLAVSNHLYPRFERYGAGRLTKVRAQAVSGASCARVARAWSARELRAAAPGRRAAAPRCVGSERSGPIGGDHGASISLRPERTAPAVVASFAAEVDEALEHPWLQVGAPGASRPARRGRGYRTLAEEGPHTTVVPRSGRGGGRSSVAGKEKTKKSAEQEAALQAREGFGDASALIS